MRLVWDTCALVSLVRSAETFHADAYEVWEEHRESVSIFPALAYFEFQATVNAIRLRGDKAIRQMFLLDGKNIVLPLDQAFITRCDEAGLADRFPTLKGGDLVFACAAALEEATLVTYDDKLREAASAAGIPVLPGPRRWELLKV
jgi:predicted nucleic acid-binding protein